MHVEFWDSWIYALRTALLFAAFAGFAWAFMRARRQAEQSSAQTGAHLETALGEIRRLQGQLTVLAAAVDALGGKLTQAHAPVPASRPAPAAASVNTRGYETAIRMARSGCGGTRGHGRRHADMAGDRCCLGARFLARNFHGICQTGFSGMRAPTTLSAVRVCSLRGCSSHPSSDLHGVSVRLTGFAALVQPAQ